MTTVELLEKKTERAGTLGRFHTLLQVQWIYDR
jgi:hypothetical protein